MLIILIIVGHHKKTHWPFVAKYDEFDKASIKIQQELCSKKQGQNNIGVSPSVGHGSTGFEPEPGSHDA